jgi:hypothetical protein
MDWSLECSGCTRRRDAAGLPTVCGECGSPWLVRYSRRVTAEVPAALDRRGRGMWRYREFLPLAEGEEPVTLGEGTTPLLPARRLGKDVGLADLWVKDDAANPTGSFKARGLAAAITRAVAAGATAEMEPQNMFWGDRYGKLTDPFGHLWSLATHIEDVAPEEMERRSNSALRTTWDRILRRRSRFDTSTRAACCSTAGRLRGGSRRALSAPSSWCTATIRD